MVEDPRSPSSSYSKKKQILAASSGMPCERAGAGGRAGAFLSDGSSWFDGIERDVAVAAALSKGAEEVTGNALLT